MNKNALKLCGTHMSSFVSTLNGIVNLSPKQTNYLNWNWQDLADKKITNKTVILSSYGDIHPFKPIPVFLCETLVLHLCDKNFLAYWLNKSVFPNVKTIYIGSHPCEYYVLTRDLGNIHLHEKYERYKSRWWSNLDNVKLISAKDYDCFVESFTSELLDEVGITSPKSKCISS